jgi:hypothetical protein
LPSERGEFHHFENPTGRFGTQIFLLLAIADDWHRKWRRGHRLDDQLDSIRPFCYWSFVLKSCPVRATKAIFSRPPGSEIYHPHPHRFGIGIGVLIFRQERFRECGPAASAPLGPAAHAAQRSRGLPLRVRSHTLRGIQTNQLGTHHHAFACICIHTSS